MAKKRKNREPTRLTEILQILNRKKRLKYALILAVIVLVLGFFATGPRGTIQLYRFKDQKNTLEQEIIALEKENKELQDLKEKIEKDPQQIEKIAREKYKMKKKDEQVYQIVEDE